jgi:hypothetical protein
MKTRREFLKYTAGGISALVVGKAIPGIMEDEAYAAVQTQTLRFIITDAVKNMATHNEINTAQCYFWIFKERSLPPECPGPHVFATEGDVIKVRVTNALDEPHAFFIRGVPGANSGPIAPGQTASFAFRAPPAGTYLYFDNLNGPVNRVMGLHGAFISMPRTPVTPQDKFTPYSAPTPNVQRLFNDLGSTGWWPGLAWEGFDDVTHTPPYRQYIWLLHQASPNLFAEVGAFTPGQDYPSARFKREFLHDGFTGNSNQNLVASGSPPTNNVPQYFTISGQAGHFSHNSPYICPNCRVGEPVLIRLLNAGLWTHSMHIHANHVYVTSINGVVQENPFWVDVFTLNPMDVVDWLNPYMRPPDVPNARGIGRADAPQISPGSTAGPHPVWPPIEEYNIRLPGAGTVAGTVAIDAQLSPLCYPMHDHSEPSQSSQGGNYNMGLISGMNVTGDRNTPGAMDFPNQPVVYCPGVKNNRYRNGVYPPQVPPPWMA